MTLTAVHENEIYCVTVMLFTKILLKLRKYISVEGFVQIVIIIKELIFSILLNHPVSIFEYCRESHLSDWNAFTYSIMKKMHFCQVNPSFYIGISCYVLDLQKKLLT